MAELVPGLRRVWIVSVLLMAPAVVAETVEVAGGIRATGAIAIQGETDGTLELGGVFYDPTWNKGRGGATVEAPTMRLLIVEESFILGDVQPPEPLWSLSVHRAVGTEVVDDLVVTGGLEVEAAPGASIRALPHGQPLRSELRVAEPIRWEAPRSWSFDRDLYYPMVDGRLMLPDGPGASWTTPSGQQLAGPLMVFVHNATLRSGDETWWTGDEYNTAPTGNDGQAGMLTRRSAIAYVDDGTVHLLGGPWTSVVTAFEGNIRGDLSFSGTTVDASIDESALRRNATLVQLLGNFSVSAVYQEGASEWGLSGNAAFVGLDGKKFLGDRFDAGDALRAAGAAAVLLVLWRYAATIAGWVAGLHRAEPLANPTRVAILQAIGTQPGLTRRELADVVGASKPTVAFHLSVLRQTGLIDVVDEGRVEHHFLNNRSFRFAHAGVPATAYFALLRHPTKRAIVETLEAEGAPLTLADVHGKNRALGSVAYSTLAGHTRDLVDAGCVERARIGRTTFYQLRVKQRELIELQAQLYVSNPLKRRIFAAIGDRPVSIAEVARQADCPEAAAADAVQELNAAGFVVANQDVVRRSNKGVMRFL